MKAVDYEKNQHERLSVRKGYGRDWVEDVEKLEPEDTLQRSAGKKSWFSVL